MRLAEQGRITLPGAQGPPSVAAASAASAPSAPSAAAGYSATAAAAEASAAAARASDEKRTYFSTVSNGPDRASARRMRVAGVGFGANIGALVTGVRTAFVLAGRVKREQASHSTSSPRHCRAVLRHSPREA